MILKQRLDHCGQECGNKTSGPQGRLYHLTFKEPFDFEVYGLGRVDKKRNVLGDLPRSNSLSETAPLDVAARIWDPLDAAPDAAHVDASGSSREPTGCLSLVSRPSSRAIAQLSCNRGATPAAAPLLLLTTANLSRKFYLLPSETVAPS